RQPGQRPLRQHRQVVRIRTGHVVSGEPPGGMAVAGDGHFTREKLAEALVAVCEVAGLDPTGADLLRMTNNAVYRLARQPVVVRIVASRTLRHRVEKVVRVATWFAEHDVPAVRLLS